MPERSDQEKHDMSNSTRPLRSSEASAQQHAERDRCHAHQRRAFHLHATVAASCMLIIVVVNAALNAATGILDEWWAWWSILALVGWSLGLSVHGIVVRLARP
jgi:hypothetical protein